MTGLQNVLRLAALGSAMAWYGTGWAQQDSDKPSKEEQAQQRESSEGRDEKSGRPGRPTVRDSAKDPLERHAEQLHDQIRRLPRERWRKGAELHAPPFHFNLRGDWYFSDPRPNDLGATIVPADESLRTQFGL